MNSGTKSAGAHDYLQFVPTVPTGEPLVDATIRQDLLGNNLEYFAFASGNSLYDTIADAVAAINATLSAHLRSQWALLAAEA